MIRLHIHFDDQNIARLVEPWVSLPDALREVAEDLENVAKSDYEEVEIDD